MLDNHSLLTEFPDKAEKIHELKISDAHFKKLFDAYHEVDHDIHRIETDTTPSSDAHLNELRIKRVSLKDDLAKYLN